MQHFNLGDLPTLMQQLLDRIEVMESRLHALELGTVGTTLGSVLVQGSLCINPSENRVLWKGHDLPMTVNERKLLEFLARHPDVIRSRDQILDLLGDDGDVMDRTIDSRVKRIRNRFRAVDPDFRQIETIYTMGYRWNRETGAT